MDCCSTKAAATWFLSQLPLLASCISLTWNRRFLKNTSKFQCIGTAETVFEWIWVSSPTGSNSLHSAHTPHPVSLDTRHHFYPMTPVVGLSRAHPVLLLGHHQGQDAVVCLRSWFVSSICFQQPTQQLGDDGIYMPYSRGQAGKTNYKKEA